MEGEAHTDTNTDVHVTPIPLLCFQLARLRGLSAPLAVQAQQLHATNAPLERQLAAIEAACHAIGSEAPVPELAVLSEGNLQVMYTNPWL